MENKLRAYMDHLFQDVPNTKKAVEVKEEILQNIVDKYHDLVAEGKSEEAAYNIAIASIGDLDELLASLKDSSQMPNQMDSENYMTWQQKISHPHFCCHHALYFVCYTANYYRQSASAGRHWCLWSFCFCCHRNRNYYLQFHDKTALHENGRHFYGRFQGVEE